MTKSIYYFAYGSNMNPERMYSRVKTVLSAQPATLCGYRLVFNKQASPNRETYANLLADTYAQTEGVLYEITQEGLDTLDLYEGISNNHYYRKSMPVYLGSQNQEKVLAEVYLACEHQICVGFPPRKYLNHLLKGKQFLSRIYLHFLQQVTCSNEPVKVAVYGTLRQNQGNHSLLQEARYLGTAETLYPYALYIQELPYVTDKKSVSPIVSEIYEVSPELLKRLDQLEGHPEFYQRKFIPMIDQKKNLVFAWMYFYESPTGRLKCNGDFLTPDQPLSTEKLPQSFSWVDNGDMEKMQSHVDAMEKLLNTLVEEQLPATDYSEADLQHFLTSLLNGQRTEMKNLKNGSWAVIPPEGRPPADIRVDFVFKPTYLAIALLNLCKLRRPNWFTNDKKFQSRFKTGLWFCTLRNLKGSGYNTITGQIDAIRILSKGQLGQSLSADQELCPKLRLLLGQFPSLV